MSTHQSRTTDPNRRQDFSPTSRGRNFDPGSPVPARITELWACCRIKAAYADLGEMILGDMHQDQPRNWRTKPTTFAEIAARFGCKERTVRTALQAIRAAFPWFNWRHIERGIVFVMQPDGTMIGKKVAPNDAKSSVSKESPSRDSTKGKRTLTTSHTVERVKNDRRSTEEPLADAITTSARLAAFRQALPVEVIELAASLGLKVSAPADRFVKYFTANPDRCPADLTKRFCRWLEEDAARKAAADRAKAEVDPLDDDIATNDGDDVPRFADEYTFAPRSWDGDSTMDVARGCWRNVFTALGVDQTIMNGKHQPCPMCGGKDRFRFDDRNGDGDYYCNGCGAGLGLKLLMGIKGWDFKRAADEIDQVTGRVARHGRVVGPAPQAEHIDDDDFESDDDFDFVPRGPSFAGTCDDDIPF
jgi:hypothetical protein